MIAMDVVFIAKYCLRAFVLGILWDGFEHADPNDQRNRIWVRLRFWQKPFLFVLDPSVVY